MPLCKRQVGDSLSGVLLEAMAKGWQSPGSTVYTH